MEFVQPIREKPQIEEMKNELFKKSYRDYMLFVVGINTGLRVSDLLNLKVSDVRERTHILIKEKKTGKIKRFLINEKLKIEIDEYLKYLNVEKDQDEYLFLSRKYKKTNPRPLSRNQAWHNLKTVAEKVGIEEFGTHSMRKTFGYWHYKQYNNIALLQLILNHSNPSTTLRYIGMNEDLKDASIEKFFL